MYHSWASFVNGACKKLRVICLHCTSFLRSGCGVAGCKDAPGVHEDVSSAGSAETAMWSETASPVRHNIINATWFKAPLAADLRGELGGRPRGGVGIGRRVLYLWRRRCTHLVGQWPRRQAWHGKKKRRSRSRSEDVVAGGIHSATRRSLATIEGSTTRRSHATTTIGGSSTTGRSLATTGVSTTKRHWEGP